MSVIGTIENALSDVGNAISDVKDWVVKTARTVYNFAALIFSHVGVAWSDLWRGIYHMMTAVADLAQQVLHVTHWIAHIHVPNFVTNAVSSVAHWVLQQIHHFLAPVINVVNHVTHVASMAWHWILNFPTWVNRHVLTPLHDVWNWVEHTAKQAVNLVLHPATLASTLASYIITPVFQFAVAHVAALVTYFVRWARSNVGAIAHEIEGTLSKLL